MRVARALSLLGACSRRRAEALISEGRVSVDGVPVTTPATLVDLDRSRLAIDGTPLARPTARYVALYKPPGVVSTVRDPHAEQTVPGLVRSEDRLYPVGRLDKDTEGLIFLTNDGGFAQAVTHPRYAVEKEYLALVQDAPTPSTLRRLRAGVLLDGRPAVPVHVSVEDRLPRGLHLEEHRQAPGAWVRVVLHEGRKREVRRMLAAVGCRVERLIRARIGGVPLGSLRPGQHRELSEAEVRSFTERPGRTSQTAALLEGESEGGLVSEAGRSPRQRARTGEGVTRARGSNETDAQELRREAGSGVVIAIDGPSGAGKTTSGGLVARRIGAAFLDTGVLYRAVSLLALEAGLRSDDAAGLTSLAQSLEVHIRGGGGSGEPAQRVLLGDRDVTDDLRRPEVEAEVSHVAAHAEVRNALIPVQRKAAEDGPLVIVGRDIGTVVFPDADLKIYLDASPEERARRRARQFGQAGDVPGVERELAQRDQLDRARSVAPLKPSRDALVIRTDGLSVADVVERVCDALAARRLVLHPSEDDVARKRP